MGRNWAITIGINEYRNLSPLRYAVRDAEAVKTFLQDELHAETVYHFTDDSPQIGQDYDPALDSYPTGITIRRFFSVQFEQPFLKPGDNLWFFFAGHGVRHKDRDYLIPIDGDPTNVESTAIPTHYIANQLRRCGADNVVMLIDACRAGTERQKGIGFGVETYPDVVAIFSCSPRESTYEIEPLQHGAFTHVLLESLRMEGEGNCATIERLYQRLRSRLPSLNKQFKKPIQTPYGFVEPPAKNHLILLPNRATLTDVLILKNEALRAEVNWNSSLAKQLWIRVLSVAPTDREAIEGLERLGILAQDQLNTSESISAISANQQATQNLEGARELSRQSRYEEVITSCEQALQKINREQSPSEWAEIQSNLATAYFNKTEGDRAENLERTIAACESALQVYTREAFPKEWAKTQILLAKAYFERIQGDRAENIEQSISAYQRALTVMNQLAMPTKSAAIMVDIAIGLKDLGELLQQQGQLNEAEASFKQAIVIAEELGDQQNLIISLNALAGVLERQSKLEEAQDILRRAIEIAQVLNDQTQLVISLNRLGGLLQQQGNVEAAIAAFERQIVIAETLNDQTQLVIGLNRLGGLLQQQGNVEAAIAAFERQIVIAETLNDRTQLVIGLNRLGGLLQQQGNVEAATAAFERQIVIAETLNDRTQLVIGLNCLGGLLQQQGNVEAAIAAFERQIVIAETLNDQTQLVIGLNRLGGLLQQQGNVEAATAAFERQIVIAETLNDRTQLVIGLNCLGGLHQQQGNVEAAIATFERSLQIKQEIGDRHSESLTLLDLADIYQALSNHQQSVDLYEQALAISQNLGDQELQISIQSELTQALLRVENFERAIAVAQSISDQEKRLEVLAGVVEEVRKLGGDWAEELLASIDHLPRLTENLQASIVRIYAKDGAVVGSGFLITSNYLVTCAHVVTQALGIPVNTRDFPSNPITLDFPFASLKQKVSAQVVFWSTIEDIAGLKLENTFPENIRPIQLPVTPKEYLSRHSFKSFGFPRGHQRGVWVSGSLVGQTAQGWLQLETNDFGYSFESGFSGAPILDEVLGSVVGMLVAVERRREAVNVAFAIPASLLSRVLNHLQSSSINAVVVSSDNQFILTGNSDGTVRLQDFRGISIEFPFQGHQDTIWSVAISPNGQLIASGSGDRTIRLWDLQGKLFGQSFRGHEGAVYSVAFSPDSQLLISGGADVTLRLWDLQGNLIAEPFQGHRGVINSVAFSPDGQVIASASDDRTIRLWNLQGNPIGEPIQGHEGWVNSIAFSPDGQLIVSGSDDRTIRLWDLQGNPVGMPFIGHTDSVSSVVFSPDAERIASSSVDQTIRVWDRQGNPVGQPLTGHTDAVKAVAFSSDGETIVSGGRDQSIRLWHLPTLLEQSILKTVSGQSTVVYDLLISPSMDMISVGEEVEVTINLNPSNSSNNGSAYLLEIPRSETLESELNILLNFSGLRLEGDSAASLPLDLSDLQSSSLSQPQIARFRLTPLRPGMTTITAEIYRGDTFETTLESTIQVVGLEESTFLDSNIKAEPRPVSQPDLVLQVQTLWSETASTCTFRYHLRSFRASSFLSSGITYQSRPLSDHWLEQVHKLLKNTLETILDALPADGRSHLTSLGQYLFQHLFPTELQTDLRNLNRYQALTLLILADQDAQFPWTLLHTGQEFLGERFIIGHWLWDLNNTYPYEFPVGAINVAHYANVEQPEVWATLLEPPGAPPPLILTGGVLDDLGYIDTMRGLHLLRMGQPAADAERQDAPVPLNVAVSDSDIGQKIRPIKLNLRRNRPLVTLGYLRDNQPELTHLQQTWAATFIRAGCSAFVGTLWAVNPATEAAFISSFYHALWIGDSLGGAFQTARQLARATVPDSLDWLAYLLFGDPMARPYRPVQGQGYAVVEPIGQDINDPVHPGSTIRFRVSLRRTPPVWHEERVIEVAETLTFDDLQAHIVTFGLQVTPATSIPLRPTPSGNYLGWFDLIVPPDITGDSALVQVYFADGMQTIHTLTFPLTFRQEGGQQA